MPGSGRLIVVSNRLPVTLERGAEGGWVCQAGAGGLVTALEPVLARRGGVWVGWSGLVDEEERESAAALSTAGQGFELRSVPLTAAERDLYYLGFSNEVLWPLFHDLQTRCTFEPAYWQAYRSANRKFAEVVADLARPGDFVWVQDYHLIPVAWELRSLGVELPSAFFLHIPFPPLDIFAKLPWRRELLEFLLAYDLVGFQVRRDRRNFTTCLATLLPEARLGRRAAIREIRWRERTVRAGAFPISVDARAIGAAARRPEVAERAAALRADLGGVQIVLGVDRLDYTKGVPFKLAAFGELFRRHPELLRRITLLQILAPSRAEIPQYQQARLEVEQLVGQINGQLGEPGWVPIHYLHRTIPHDELLAYYRAADVCLATPLKDGMNLVAKEYCAARVDREGVLVLSEFAGAARQLGKAALLVNPYDVVGLADTLARAFHMQPAERRSRMAKLRRGIRKHDIFWWVDAVLAAAAAGAVAA
ncbi:MAG: alpha,alpha-trehalose-phosphate synthase (UDP-forming) [Acidobacteriota bacterium]